MRYTCKELWFEVPTRRTSINITPQMETCFQEIGERLDALQGALLEQPQYLLLLRFRLG
jgi:hypothetical protein